MDKKKLEVAIDALLKEYRTPAEIVGPDGLLKQMTKALLERAKQRQPYGMATTRGLTAAEVTKVVADFYARAGTRPEF
jgi:hypothetical protein